VGKSCEEWFETTRSAQGLLHFRDLLGGGVEVGAVELLNGWTQELDLSLRSLPEMEAWMGAFNGNVHSFTSNWRELRTMVENLTRE
jgi:hypothetical protein